MAPPGARLVGTVGDPGLEQDGGRVWEVSSGRFELEWIEAPPEKMDLDDPKARWTAYTIVLDQEIPDWGDIMDVARSVGISMMEIASQFMSPDPIQRAYGYITWAEHYGFYEFDQYPREMKKWEVEKRYGVKLGTTPKPLPLSGVTPIPFQRKTHSVVITDDTNGEEYELKTGHGTKDTVNVFKVSDDAYYVLVYSTRGLNYVGLAFFGRVRDLDQGKPHDPGGEVFLQTDHEIENVFGPDGFRDLDEDEMIEKLQHYV